MRTKIFRAVLFSLCILTLFILLPAYFGLMIPFVIGGVITGGILGGFKGKVGAVVGGKWKGIDYMRGYVVPTNPNTAGQITQRSKFSRAVAIGKLLLSTVLQPYWDMYNANMSGFNRFIQYNTALLTAVTYALNTSNKVSLGSLTGASGVVITVIGASGIVSVAYDNNSGVGNALSTDIVVVVIAKIDGSQVWIFDDDSTTRADSGWDPAGTITSGLTPTTLIGFVFFKRGTGADQIVSDSTADIMSET